MTLLSNEVVLRPRFTIELEFSNEEALRLFEESKTTDFVISRIDDHVFIRIPRGKQHFWSPQLHLEIEPMEDGKSLLRGLFGPKPSIWTMFMFAHLIVATIFIIFGIWAYSNWSINNDFIPQLVVMFFMLIIWFGLYFAGRMGKDAGKGEMRSLYDYMLSTLSAKQSPIA
ncbi:GTP-binding protein [Sungkyunkwania multivorans]|uniref:GTP-binding protein n=1 Tax=Sungkyunkwania multivorans TaxID=1173618 RepID=A0ABW3D2C3_9FLAO